MKECQPHDEKRKKGQDSGMWQGRGEDVLDRTPCHVVEKQRETLLQHATRLSRLKGPRPKADHDDQSCHFPETIGPL